MLFVQRRLVSLAAIVAPGAGHARDELHAPGSDGKAPWGASFADKLARATIRARNPRAKRRS